MMRSSAEPHCVVPVADYEPPLLRGRPKPDSPAVARPHPPPRARPLPWAVADASAVQAAGTFADAALRRVLEVIDRRRPLAHLRPLLAGGLVDSLLAAARRHGGHGAARLRRLRVQPVGPAGTAAEVAATYSRGGRVHAIACRVAQVETPSGLRWQVVALHLG